MTEYSVGIKNLSSNDTEKNTLDKIFNNKTRFKSDFRMHLKEKKQEIQ